MSQAAIKLKKMSQNDKFILLKDFEISIPEDLKSLIPGFISRREEDLQTMQTLLQEKRLPEVAKIGHRMKGHGVSYGFEALSLIGKRIEHAANQDDLAQTELLISNLHILVKEISARYGTNN